MYLGFNFAEWCILYAALNVLPGLDTTVTYSLNLTLTTWMCSVQCPPPPCSGSILRFWEQNYLNLWWLLSLLKHSVMWCSSALRDTSWQQSQLFAEGQSCSSLGCHPLLWEASSSSLTLVESVQVGCSVLTEPLLFVVCFFPRLCSSDIKYTARWSNETVFSSILISPKMITDHMPDVVLKALNSLSQEHASCLSCQTREYDPSAV